MSRYIIKIVSVELDDQGEQLEEEFTYCSGYSLDDRLDTRLLVADKLSYALDEMIEKLIPEAQRERYNPDEDDMEDE